MKSAVSLAVVVILVALFGLRPPDAKQGGIQMVSADGAADLVGPTLGPDAQQYDAYIPKYIPTASVMAEPAPTPEPYYVYCNDGGKYYHVKKCRYVKATTPRATILRAVEVGFKRCKDCNAPTVADIYGET